MANGYLIDARAAIEMLSVGENELQTLVARGDLRAFRSAGTMKFRPDDVQELQGKMRGNLLTIIPSAELHTPSQPAVLPEPNTAPTGKLPGVPRVSPSGSSVGLASRSAEQTVTIASEGIELIDACEAIRLKSITEEDLREFVDRGLLEEISSGGAMKFRREDVLALRSEEGSASAAHSPTEGTDDPSKARGQGPQPATHELTTKPASPQEPSSQQNDTQKQDIKFHEREQRNLYKRIVYSMTVPLPLPFICRKPEGAMKPNPKSFAALVKTDLEGALERLYEALRKRAITYKSPSDRHDYFQPVVSRLKNERDKKGIDAFCHNIALNSSGKMDWLLERTVSMVGVQALLTGCLEYRVRQFREDVREFFGERRIARVKQYLLADPCSSRK